MQCQQIFIFESVQKQYFSTLYGRKKVNIICGYYYYYFLYFNTFSTFIHEFVVYGAHICIYNVFFFKEIERTYGRMLRI